jgi:hypothetical protein
VLRIAATHECLADNDIYIHVRACRRRQKVEICDNILYSRSPPKVTIPLFCPLPQWPALLFRTLNIDVVIKPGPNEVAQLNCPTRPSSTHGHLRPLQNEAKLSGKPEMYMERCGQPIGGPSTFSRSGNASVAVVARSI